MPRTCQRCVTVQRSGKPCVRCMLDEENIGNSEMAYERSVRKTSKIINCFLEITTNITESIKVLNEVGQVEEIVVMSC